MGGGRRAAGLWARVDLRRRWRSLVVLGLLAGVTAGFAMAALAGARRTDTALDRLKKVTNAPDAIVFASQVGVFEPDFAKLRARPEVQDLAVWDLVFGNFDGEPGAVLFASDDGRFGEVVSKPVLVAGRMWAPKSTDEILIDEQQARNGTSIGDTGKFEMLGPTIEDLVYNRANGPTITLKVVGIVRDVREHLFATTGSAYLPPGFVPRYRGTAAIHPNADVVLRKGADVATLRKIVNDVIGPGTPVLDLRAAERRVDTTLSVERSALLLVALAIAVAGGLLVGQALIRSAAAVGDDALVLRAIGFSRFDVAIAASLGHALSALVAGGAAVTTAVAASRWFPVGLGRRIDPAVGVHADWVVIGPGVLLTFALMLGGTIAVAARVSSMRAAHRPRRGSAFATRVRRRAPLTVGLGTTLAFDRGRGATSIPVRPALVGAVVGVLGVIGALTIDRGLKEALAHPERAGVTWDVTAQLPPDAFTLGRLKPDVARAAGDASDGTLAVINRQLVPVNGVGSPALSLRAADGDKPSPIHLALIAGRAPRTADEIAIGPATAREIGATVGDRVRIGEPSVTVTIVGQALFPADVHGQFDEGIWLVPDQLDQLVPPDESSHGLYLAVRLPTGSEIGTATAGLQRALPDGTEVSAAEVPVELMNLRNVRTLPVLLAGLLALLAVGALSHVLVASSRRRRHDFAVLSALGLEGRRIRLILNTQGTAIGLAGLAVGVPLGVAVGRTLWRLVTDQVPLTAVAPFAFGAMVLIVPITVLVANALAVWPGHRLTRLRPAEELRTD